MTGVCSLLARNRLLMRISSTVRPLVITVAITTSTAGLRTTSTQPSSQPWPHCASAKGNDNNDDKFVVVVLRGAVIDLRINLTRRQFVNRW